MTHKALTNKVSDDEKYTIYGIFDGLNFLFGIADPKSLEIVINQDLFQGLLELCTLDTNEIEYMSKSSTSNDFYQLQSGANRKHYKEFGYAFITDLIKIPQATVPFLMFCVKTFTENIGTNPAKASAALFILALCDREQLEAQKTSVA